MRRIINGKMYDTKTAQYIGNATDGLGESDFSYYSEDLYKKKTGEFFLAGEGGGRSRYSAHIPGNMRGYGYKIIPLTLRAAKEWCEENLSTDEYIEVFGEAEE